MSRLWSTMAKRAKPYIPGEQLNKPNIIKLNTNENPYGPSPHVVAAISEEVGNNLRLYPSPTMDTLRETIGRYYEVKKDNVFIGNGSDEVLAFSFMAFFEPGRKIKFPNISYSFYPVYANIYDIDYEEVPLQNDFTIDVEQFFHSEGGVIFPNPNAPTSIFLPIEQIELIAQNNKDRVVIVDEAYVDFAESSAIGLTKKYDNILVIQTMSKSRSLAGLRVGFAIGDAKLIEALIRMKDSFNSYPVDRLAMAGAIAAMNDQAYFKKTIEKVKQTRTYTTEQLQLLGFHVLPSSTNFVFATHPHVDAASLYEELRENNILIRYFGTELIDQYVRITIGTDEEMQALMQTMKQIMDE